MQKLASETRVAILIVHHVKKGSAESHVEKISGTYGLAGGVDAYLVLDGNSADTTLASSGRDIIEMDLSVKFNSDACRWEVIGPKVTVENLKSRDKIISVLRGAENLMTPTIISQWAGMPVSTVRQALRRMAEKGEILQKDHGHYAHPTRPDLLEK